MHVKKIVAISALVLFLLSGVPLLVSDESDSAGGNLLISEVSPADEAVKIRNYGSSTVDLKGYILTDGEGKLSFSSSYKISAGGYVIVSKATGTDWFNSRSNTILFTHSSITKSGSFVLADSGDEVLLQKGSTTVDSVCYGKATGADGWKGPAVPISSGQYLVRKDVPDTDTGFDWKATKPGWTSYDFLPDSGYDAVVKPFTFPESNGIPVLNALSESSRTVDISIYLLSSPQVASLLCQLEKRGVQVRVLIEGTPLGVDIGTELSLMKSLVDSGGEVRIIDYSGAKNCRYTYVHNKYAVIDGNKVVITSENWTSGNIGEFGNRGWGAVIESSGYAAYMGTIFENDFSKEWGDVSDLMSVYPNVKPKYDLSYSDPGAYPLPSFSARVCPAMSPDNSFSALRQVISSAAERLYAEQMDLGSSLSGNTGETPIAWMSQVSKNGVDVKFILDSSQTDSGTHEGYVSSINNSTSIQAITVNGRDGFSLIHNKGLIIDDSVWVGSVNWTDTSFLNNRESAVVIRSKEVSDYFADYFLRDYGVNIFTVEENGLMLNGREVHTPRGNMVLFTVSGPEGSEYSWNLGNGEVRRTDSGRLLVELPPGTYSVTVSMLGSDLSDTIEYSVSPGSRHSGTVDMTVYISLAAAVCILALGIAVFLIRDRRDDSSAGYRCVSYRPCRRRR